MRSRSSRGRESSRLNEGSNEGAGAATTGWVPEGFRRRTRRLGDLGGASSMVVSEEPLLPLDERDRDCGVEVREAMAWNWGTKEAEAMVVQARRGVQFAKVG
jgi:hypothetical protein